MDPAQGFILDTSVLVHLARARDLGQKIDAKFALRGALHRSMICVVTVGECLALAKHRNWGADKTQRLRTMLEQLVVIDLNQRAILDAYAEIDEACRHHPIGQNDMWIAAVCRATGVTLLTTDKDFDHLHPTLIQRIWIDPKPDLGASP